MSKKQWMVLLMLFLTYLLLGASIFYHIESGLEIEQVKKAKQERIEINALLHQHYMPKNVYNQQEILDRLTNYCGKSVLNITDDEPDQLKWDFYNSFYFAYTVVSTIGYGNLAPTTTLSRVLMIFYGLLGIPMNGILLAQLGEFFSIVFVRAHQKYKSYKNTRIQECEYTKKPMPLETRKAGFAAQIFMYLTPGIVMFIFFPAFLFTHFENNWTYEQSVYYAFVTLTTIGFGDFVAGQDNTRGNGVTFILYKIFLIVWISFGLGYIVMIMTFIARGMRSKKITRIEHKLAMNLKHTQSKIWNEFNKEVNYLRRVFNELQLSKVKRVYVDECDYIPPPCKFPRSCSFPDLRDLVYGGLEIPVPRHPRRRANSEVIPMDDQVTRVVSETDLQRIDKTATFATHAMVQPAELLARLVNILGYIPPPDESADTPEPECDHQGIDDNQLGVQGFSDKEILANENTWNSSKWKIGDDKPPFYKPRSRAASEVRLETKNDSICQQNSEWTWSGPAASRKIQELIKSRRTGLSSIKDAKSKFPSLTLPKSVPKTLFPRWIKQLSNKKTPDETPKPSDLTNDVEDDYSQNTYSGINRRESVSRPYFTHTGANLPSYLESNNLLEETSLADFLRALTALHTRVGAVPDEYVRKPQRKMGTASLTPPKLPSLLSLFSPLNGSASTTQSNQTTITQNSADRRFSLRTADNSGMSTPTGRRGSLAPAAKPRRFSLRPVITPSSTPPQHASPYLSNIRHSSVSPPPYSPDDSYIFESSKKPLVQMEGAPGVSSPIATAPNTRRFSLRPAQIGVPPAPATPKITQNLKGVPRWRAGMLQRQIGQMSIQRRVRAFSLSDVQADLPDRTVIPSNFLRESNSNLKTVTIASPEREFMQTSSAKQPPETEISSPDAIRNESNVESPFMDSLSSERKSNLHPITEIRRDTSLNSIEQPSSINQSSEKSKEYPKSSMLLSEGGNEAFNIALQSTLGPEKLNKLSKYSHFTGLEPREDSIKMNIMREDNSLVKLPNTVEDKNDIECSNIPSELQSTGVSQDNKAVPSTSGGVIDKRKESRKISPVSVSTWEESQRNTNRKISTVSSQSQPPFERRKSSIKPPNEKPRVSIDSYKPLLEVKVEKPSVDPFEQYKATINASRKENEDLVEVKVIDGAKQKIFTKSKE